MKKMFLALLISFKILVVPTSAQKFERDTTYRKTPVVGFIAPLALIGGGLALNNADFKKNQLNYRQQNFPNFHNKIDDLMQFAPHGAVFALDWIGVKSKHNFKDKVGLMLTGGIITLGTVLVLKSTTDEFRPDNSSANSFPSGHTANAFFGAAVLAEEYKDQSIIYPILGYSAATATGVFRILNNRHWASDVLVGAGVGILSAKAAYVVYPWLKEKIGGKSKPKNVVFMPVYDGVTAGGSLVVGF
ncbi:MAG: phosphatase PAP2 family protein [Arcicella sp.]|nr:phosphatase PAP2 family protein [Arcicella sp.]